LASALPAPARYSSRKALIPSGQDAVVTLLATRRPRAAQRAGRIGVVPDRALLHDPAQRTVRVRRAVHDLRRARRRCLRQLVPIHGVHQRLAHAHVQQERWGEFGAELRQQWRALFACISTVPSPDFAHSCWMIRAPS